MLLAQRFAVDHIYCAPGQDTQYSFKLVRVNKRNLPVKGRVNVYNRQKTLPNMDNLFHVYTLGNLPPAFLNLLGQKEHWFKDVWVKVSDDMVARDMIFQMYTKEGIMYPRQNIYYSFTDERGLLIAQELIPAYRTVYPVDEFEYMRVYSSAFFKTVEHNSNPNKVGIDYRFTQVENNSHKASLQMYISQMNTKGGNVIVYVNGLYADSVHLSIPDYSYVELVYDQSVVKKESFPLEHLRTFSSTKDSRLKYIIYRSKTTDYIEFFDDTEVYVSDTSSYHHKGLFFYRHKDHSMRNITDKDFSLDSMYVNNTAAYLNNLTVPGHTTKRIVIFSRKSGRETTLKHSALKLHEFYKLPQNTQYDVLTDSGHTVDIYRADYLENSSYFDVVSARRISDITPSLAVSASGYNGIAKYLADTPLHTTERVVDVPELYQWRSTAIEYNAAGEYLGYNPTGGPLYTCSSTFVKTVEFVHGRTPLNFGTLHDHNGQHVLRDNVSEYVVLSAYFTGVTRESVWTDITDTNLVSLSGNTLTFNESSNKKIKVVYLNDINLYDLELPLTNGVLYFPLTNMEDRGTGYGNFTCDVPYANLRVYLNKRRLTMGLDYFVKFPYICITNKKYLNYSLLNQQVTICGVGCTTDPSAINQHEVRGFVNHGVLGRNKRYDIREDRVYSVFIDGLIKNRETTLYSEEDNLVRTGHVSNGLPYTITDSFIPLKFLTGVSTKPLYDINRTNDKKISDLYDLVFPEPVIDQFNVIGTSHFLYSPTVSKIINDVITGVIPSSLYTNPYDNAALITLFDTEYRHLIELDPVKKNLQDVVVEIQPHIGNNTINVTLHQYRFISNVVRLLTNNQPDKVNLSGYLSVTV